MSYAITCEEKCKQDHQTDTEIGICVAQACGEYKINTITKSPATVGHNHKEPKAYIPFTSEK